MAFYGSSAANLSPILFKGNLFSNGVNIIFHSDISYSMNLIPGGSVNYLSSRTGGPGEIGPGAKSTMFYDGLFPAYFHRALLTNKVGSRLQSSPNLYGYFDATLRQTPSTQSLSENTETYTFNRQVILGDSNYSNYQTFKDLWSENYIDNDQGVFTQEDTFNITSKLASESTQTRFADIDIPNNPGQLSEDVHGNIWSLYYSGTESDPGDINNKAYQLTEGLVESSYFGFNLDQIPRRNLATYYITASNEQENTASSLLGIGITTKNNVGYNTDKYLFNNGGVYVRRYDHYYLDPTFNPDVTDDGSTYTDEVFERWFNEVAVPLPLGVDSTGTDEDAPGVNWFQGGNGNDDLQNLGGTQRVDPAIITDPTDSAYADVDIAGTPGSDKSAFWGPVFEIDRLRSDISDYSLMIIGYFAPQKTGTFRFKLQSNGASFLWIGTDDESGGGINGSTKNSKVYRGWTVSNATIACPTTADERYNIIESGSAGNDARKTPFQSESSEIDLTANRFYPFRIIVGNPIQGNNDFPSNGNIITADLDSNSSFLRLLFDTDENSGSESYGVNGTGYFFGGTQVWEEGSLFFRPPIEVEERRIEQEVLKRNLRVIGISGYDSDDGYDAVFFKGAGQYIYANLTETDFTFTPSTDSPTVGNWRFADYFDPINYTIGYDSGEVQKQDNTVLNNIGPASGAEFNVTKLNDRYNIELIPGSEGSNFRINDKFAIFQNFLGETDDVNRFVIEVTEVAENSYTVTATSADNFNDRILAAATFDVEKDASSYTITLINGGENYEENDQIFIPGTDLDGTSPANDIVITITGITNTPVNGTIDTFTFTGTPTSYIEYSSQLSVYNPRPIEISYDTLTDIDSISYRSANNTGISYTTGSIITGIAYTTNSVSGIAYSTLNVTGISYTSISNDSADNASVTSTIGIAYSTVNVTGISYTTSSVSGLAYTFGDIQSITYRTGSATGIGYTNTDVVSIGYTAPNVVSIGYTTFESVSISYDTTSIGVATEFNSANTQINVPTGHGFNGGETIIIKGTNTPIVDSFEVSLDAQEFTLTVIDDFTFELDGVQGAAIPGGQRSFDFSSSGYYVQISDNVGGAVGITSLARLGIPLTDPITLENLEPFNVGDQIIFDGSTFNSGESFVSLDNIFEIEFEDANFYYLKDTGTVGLVTFSASSLYVGYDQAELELEIPFTTSSTTIGISSIFFPEYYTLNSFSEPVRLFNDIRQSTVDPNSLVLRLGNPGTSNELTSGGLAGFVAPGDVVYLFFNDGEGDLSSDGTARKFDFSSPTTNVGYGHTVLAVNGLETRFRIARPAQYSAGDIQDQQIDGYWLKADDTIRLTSSDLAFGETENIDIFNNADSFTISGNNYSPYNTDFEVFGSVTSTLTQGSIELQDPSTGTLAQAEDYLQAGVRFDNFDNPSASPGNANAGISTVDYIFEVGMGITVFGVTGESAIYNDGYTILGIKSTSNTVPYAFILEENQTPTELVSRGTSGKIGIHTLSGIATVTSTANFGSPGDVIDLKIQDAPAVFFNQTYTNATILDSTRFLLGSNSFRDEDTENPTEYSSSSNTDGNTISGLIGARLEFQYTLSSLSIPYDIDETDFIDLYNTTSFNQTNLNIRSITEVLVGVSSILEFDSPLSTNATDFSLSETGDFGIRDIGPRVTFTDSFGFPSPWFGLVSDTPSVKIQDSLNTELNGSSYTSVILSSGTIDITDPSSHNPTDYTAVGAGGTIGLNGSESTLKVPDTSLFPDGSSLRVQNTIDQNGAPFITNTFYLNTTIIDGTNIELDGIQSNNATVYGRVAQSGTGIVGLIEDPVVTTSSSHPFVDGDSIQLDNVTGNGGIFDNIFTISYIDPTSFTLNSASGGSFTDDFTDANGTGGIALLRDYPATVVFGTNLPQGFETGATIQIENSTAEFDGNYTITKIDSTRFTLNGKINPTVLDSTSSTGYIALTGVGPVVNHSTTRRSVSGLLDLPDGSSVKIQGSTLLDDSTAYTTIRYSSGEFAISTAEIPDPATFRGVNEDGSGTILGLIGSNLIVRSTAHNVSISDEIRLENAGVYDGLYTVTEIENANRFVTDDTSTLATDFSVVDNSATLGYREYPAIATFDSVIDSSFAVGTTIDILNTDGTDTPTFTQLVQPALGFTIVSRDDSGSQTKLGLEEAVNPASSLVVEDNGGSGYFVGLRNSPAQINFSSGSLSEFGTIGDIVNINIDGTDSFNGDYTAKIISATRLDLVSPSLENPSDYIPDGDVNGLIGLGNSDAIVTISGGHGFTASDVGVTEIYINTGNFSRQTDFGNNRTVSEILDSNRFTISGTQNPTDYSIEDFEGYFVYANRGALARQTDATAFVRTGDGITISGTTNFNGNKTVGEKPPFTDTSGPQSAAKFIFNTTYPSNATDGDGRPDYTITETGFYVPRLNPNGGSGGNAVITTRRNANGTYTISGVQNAGNQYRRGEQYLITGDLLGGVSGTNDLVITLNAGSVNESSGPSTPGSLTGSNISVSGSAETPLDYDTPKSTTFVTGSGSGAQFQVVRKGERLPPDSPTGIATYSEVTLLSGGSGYVNNQVIRLLGSNFDGDDGSGGPNPDGNDLYIYVNNVSSGSLTGTGFTFAGESYEGAALVNSGLTTVYNNGGLSRSRPYGLEEVWDVTTDGQPPAGQGRLSQKHDVLTLAELNKGGVVKIDKVYNKGSLEDPTKYNEIEHITFYPVISSIDADSGSDDYEASVLFDTGGNSGIATIIFDNDTDGQVFRDLEEKEGEEIWIFTSSHQDNPIARIDFLDYRTVGYGFTILGAYSAPNSVSSLGPVDAGNGFNNLDSTTDPGNANYNAGFAFGTGIDQVVIQTANINATEFDDSRDLRCDPDSLDDDGLFDDIVIRDPSQNVEARTENEEGMQALIVHSDSILTIRTKGICTFEDDDEVTLQYSYNPLGFDQSQNVTPVEGTVIGKANKVKHRGWSSEPFDRQSGLGYTTYGVRRFSDENGIVPNAFQCYDLSTGIGITAGFICPNGEKMIEYIARSYTPWSNEPLLDDDGTTGNQTRGTVLLGRRSDTFAVNGWRGYGFGSINPLAYQYVGGGTTDSRVGGSVGLGMIGGTADGVNDTRDGRSHVRIAVGGEAFVVGAGTTPLDNREGLAKALAQFIADTSET